MKTTISCEDTRVPVPISELEGGTMFSNQLEPSGFDLFMVMLDEEPDEGRVRAVRMISGAQTSWSRTELVYPRDVSIKVIR